MKKAIHIKNDNLNQNSFTIQHQHQETIRLNKYISNSGFCSRREADRYIESGKVKIDDKIAQLGDHVVQGQIVKVNETVIQILKEFVYIVLHKPTGIICTTDSNIQDNISDFMDYEATIFPVGRLDRDSSGLILLTNDGDIVNKILRAKHHHEKEYIVTVHKSIDEQFIEKLSQGIRVYNPVNNTYQVTKKCKVSKMSDKTFRIILTEGLNRQIRRMCKALGYHVQTLKRIRIMNIHLESLPVGHWRYVSVDELKKLNDAIQ